MGDRLFVLQPVFASYRDAFFRELAKSFACVELYADLTVRDGFKCGVGASLNIRHTPIVGSRTLLYYQFGFISALIFRRPSVVFITADFRAVHFWLTLLISSISKIPLFSHGQGLYDKPQTGLLRKLLFRFVLRFSSKYVCYTESVRQSLISVGLNDDKLAVMDNTLVNSCPVELADKSPENRVLFVGRLREGSELGLLFEAMEKLRNAGLDIALDIIGDGVLKTVFENIAREKQLSIRFHGAIYDDKTISDISKRCKVGVYPGDAGLSLVHYMSLSLIPIVHGTLTKHMGPEPSYIVDGKNGLFFERGNPDSLAEKIYFALNDCSCADIGFAAYQTYKRLSQPTMAQKLFSIMSPYLKGKMQ